MLGFKGLKGLCHLFFCVTLNGQKNIFELMESLKCYLVLPKVKTTWHGLKSTLYTASKAWNSLSDELRSTANIKLFRKEVRKISSFG